MADQNGHSELGGDGGFITNLEMGRNGEGDAPTRTTEPDDLEASYDNAQNSHTKSKSKKATEVAFETTIFS